MKHTPGPWNIDETEDTLFIRAESKLDAIVAQIELNSEVCTTMDEVDPGQQHRNAYLISAAPELLSLAEAYLVLVTGMEVTPALRNKRDQFFAAGALNTLIARLQDVIAKAKGE